MSIIPSFLLLQIRKSAYLKRTLENIAWLFIDKIFRMGIGLAVGVLLARYLGPEQFGIFNFAIAFVGMFSAIAAFGLNSIVVRNLINSPNEVNDTIGTAAFIQLGAGLVAYILAIGSIFWLRPDDPLSKILVVIIGSSLIFKAAEVSVFWFESQLQSKYYVWVQNSNFLFFAIFKILLIINNAPLISFAWVAISESIIVSIFLVLVFQLWGPGLKHLKVKLDLAKKLIADSWPLLLSGLTITIYMKIDQVMLGQMIGDEAVGIYSAATRISEIWYFIPTAIVASFTPAILEAKKNNDGQYHKRLQALYDLMVFLSVVIAIPITFISTSLVTTLYGPIYAESGQILAIHIWNSVFVFLGVASSQWFVAENRQILSFQRSFFGAILNIAFNYLLIPSYGAVGAAISTLFSQFFVGILFDSLQSETRGMFAMKVAAFNPLAWKKNLRALFRA